MRRDLLIELSRRVPLGRVTPDTRSAALGAPATILATLVRTHHPL
jgi:hypothetical protein